MVNEINTIDELLEICSKYIEGKEELETIKQVLSKSKDGINCFFKEGITATQNRFN